MIPPSHFHRKSIHTDVPCVLLASADVEIVPGTLSVAGSDLRQHDHQAESIAHSASDTGNRQRQIFHEFLLHRGGHFRRFGLQRSRLAGDFDAFRRLSHLQNGIRWRLDYKSNGYLFVNVSNGMATSGPWRAEDGRLCTHMRGGSASCNEVREQGQRLYLKRDNGDVIALNPQ